MRYLDTSYQSKDATVISSANKLSLQGQIISSQNNLNNKRNKSEVLSPEKNGVDEEFDIAAI